MKRPATIFLLMAAHVLTLCSLFAEDKVVKGQQSPPFDFSAAARWKKLSRDTFASPGPYLGTAIGAAFGVAGNSPREWGQGSEAYGRHLGDILGRNLIQQSVAQSGQAWLGLDPTYRRCECQGALHRIANAFAGTFTSFDRAGNRRFDPMPLAGAYASGIIATHWYPSRYDPLVKGFQLGHRRFAMVPVSNLVSEFLPELRYLNPFRRGHKK